MIEQYMNNIQQLWREDQIFHLELQHCVKSAQIRSYFWFVFSCIRTEYGDLPLVSVGSATPTKIVIMILMPYRILLFIIF